MNYNTDIEVLNSDVFKDTLMANHPYLLRAVYENWTNESTNNKTYKPFVISWEGAYSVHKRELLCQVLSHDIAHALDYFMRNQRYRILKPNFGIPVAFAGDVWKKKWLLTEINVLSLQNAILQNAGILPDDEHFTKVILGHLVCKSSLDFTDEKEHDELIYFMESNFKFWKNNFDIVRISWNHFVDFCNRYKRSLTLTQL